MNTIESLYETDINKIGLKHFENAIHLCFLHKLKHHAPLGSAGDNITLHGTHRYSRQSLIQLRNYNGDPELLITDITGNFLFYGKHDKNLGVKYIAEKFYQIFLDLKHLIKTEFLSFQNKPTLEIINLHLTFNFYDKIESKEKRNEYREVSKWSKIVEPARIKIASPGYAVALRLHRAYTKINATYRVQSINIINGLNTDLKIDADVYDFKLSFPQIIY